MWSQMKLISCEELRQKLDRTDDFKLRMVLGDWQYRARYILGSLNNSSPNDPKLRDPDPNDEIVVHCSDVGCVASICASHRLADSRDDNVRRYAG